MAVVALLLLRRLLKSVRRPEFLPDSKRLCGTTRVTDKTLMSSSWARH
jgi:hypothetical protein